MSNRNNDSKRNFSYEDSVLYNGALYPTTHAYMDDGSGIARDSMMFADANGQYYTMDDKGKAYPVMLQHELPEVEVTPSKEEMLANAFGRYLTMSNDNTRVNNVPHREYNSHLRESALRGAREHALWDKEHPNLAAWRDFTTAIPFGVAAAPVAMGLGETALGQTVAKGADALMHQPIMQLADGALGLGFASNGINNATHGEFTPETALDIMGLPIGAVAEFNLINGLKRNDRNLGKYLTNETHIPRNLKKEGTKRYIDFIQSPEYGDRLRRAGLEDQWDNIKNLTDERINGFEYFPGRMQKVVKGEPENAGISSANGNLLENPYYGITIKRGLSPHDLTSTLDHELAHFATKNAGVYDKGFIGDMMRYNEGIAPNIPWEEVITKAVHKNPNITVDEALELNREYSYLTDPQEKRARAMEIYQGAKDNNISTDTFIDYMLTPGKKIVKTTGAVPSLDDMLRVMYPEDLKKYVNNFLGISAPIGVGATLLNNSQDGQ